MYKRLIGCLLLANIILSILVPSTISTDNSQWWDENWSFRQEISIPINTTSTHAHYQPIDIFIEFDNPCWAKNEEEHSLRIIFQDESIVKELELQIYDLVHTDDNYISACSLVFLIPGEANGNEKYYIYYDNERKSSPIYPDRVSVDESYYRYEPILGLLFESSFYKITEGDYIVYGVNKEGVAFGDPITQQVVKLKKNSEEVRPKNGEELASFHFTYWYNDGKWNDISTSERLVSNQIFVDGNLMVKFGIISESTDGLFRSTVIYKYYYCPTEDKRIYTHVKHEVISYPLPVGKEIEAGYVTLSSGGVKSSNIEELNFGRIPPYLHFYSDEERIRTYDIEQYPEGKIHVVISKKEDCDLGSSPWASFDDGVTGKAHAVIFESNNVIQSGVDTRDGIQLQLYEEEKISLPGIDGSLAILYMTKNTYEEGEKPDDVLPKDFVVEFDAEFFTTENEGYPGIEKEASIYQKLVSYQPTHIDNITDDGEPESKYELTVYPRLSQSLFLEIGFATLMLKNPYITVELYRNNSLFTSARANRFALDPETVIDWENISLFRRARFDKLPAGPYLIKIWFENPPFEDERQFIGWQLIDLQEDAKTRIKCVPAGWIQVSVFNQYGGGVEHAQVYIIKDDVIIAEGESNITGNILISVPCDLKDTYTLKVAYKGFLVYEQQIRVGLIRKILPLKIPVGIAVHDVTINVQNDQGNAPSFNMGMKLTSDDMEYPTEIMPDESSPGTYIFSDLYPADYALRISYQSFEVEEKIQIPKISSMTIILYDFVVNVKDTWDLPPGINLDIVLTSDEFKKPVTLVGEQLSAEVYRFADLYPANYTLKLSYKSFIVEESIQISPYSSDELTMVFPAEFNVTTTIFDVRGIPLSNAKVVVEREGQKLQGITDETGDVMFSLPPGVYVASIYSSDNLIAKRKIDFSSKRKFDIVTKEENLLPFIVTGIMIAMIVGIGILMYKKKDVFSFLKMVAIAIAIIAIVLPWWAIGCTSSMPEIETSTKMYLIPTELVTITSSEGIVAGELHPLDETFVFALSVLPYLIALGSLCIVASLFHQLTPNKKLSFLAHFTGVFFLIGSLFIFSQAVVELSKATVGPWIGSGDLDIIIPGEEIYAKLNCSWGPDIGFYLLLLSIGILIFTITSNIRKKI